MFSAFVLYDARPGIVDTNRLHDAMQELEEHQRFAHAWLTRNEVPGQFWPGEPELIDETQMVPCEGCGREVPLHDMGLIPAEQPSTLSGLLRCLDCWAQSRVPS